VSSRAFKPHIQYSTTSGMLRLGRQCLRWLTVQFFVANVNANDGKLKANVNKFSNDNVWNAKYENRIVVPETQCFSFIYLEEFSFRVLSSILRACGLFHLIVLKVRCIFHLEYICFPRLFAGRILHHQLWKWLW